MLLFRCCSSSVLWHCDCLVGTEILNIFCLFISPVQQYWNRSFLFRSTLTSAMFSAVRDGYYNELRKQRRASSALPLMKTRSSLDTSTDGSSRGDADEHSRRGSRFAWNLLIRYTRKFYSFWRFQIYFCRSISPMDSSVTKEETADESNKSDKSSNLLRPQLRGYWWR